MNPEVDFYFNKPDKWQKALEQLRVIMLDCGLNEELKWGVPTYTFQKNNILLIHTFKEYFAILFMKGVLMNDSERILYQQTKNVQSARQIRFTEVQDIEEMQVTLKAYIYEAMEIEKLGLKVALKKSSEFKIIDEFQQRLEDFPALKTAFYSLTPGRQNGYLLHFAEPKQSKTRTARIEKYTEQIMNGKGLNDDRKKPNDSKSLIT